MRPKALQPLATRQLGEIDRAGPPLMIDWRHRSIDRLKWRAPTLVLSVISKRCVLERLHTGFALLVDRFRRFCTVHQCSQPTHSRTYHATCDTRNREPHLRCSIRAWYCWSRMSRSCSSVSSRCCSSASRCSCSRLRCSSSLLFICSCSSSCSSDCFSSSSCSRFANSSARILHATTPRRRAQRESDTFSALQHTRTKPNRTPVSRTRAVRLEHSLGGVQCCSHPG